MRSNKLIVELNTRIKGNVHFADPETGTILTITQPRSMDLNRMIVDKRTGQQVQLNINNRIQRGLDTNVIRVVEGAFGKYVAEAQAPIFSSQAYPPEVEQKWRDYVMNAIISKATNQVKKQGE